MTTETLTLMIAERLDDKGDIMRLTLTDPTGAPLPPVTAGAHIDVLVATDSDTMWRQYSLAGDPADRSNWTLGILKEPASRGGSVALHDIARKGAELRITGPRNHFGLVEADKTYLYGGGVGVTPMLAMAYELHARGAAFELHYCTRSADRAAFDDLLRAAPFAESVHQHHDDAESKFNTDALPDPADDTHLYICGPEGFMSWLIGAAEARGHASAHIHREYFSADVDVTGDTFEVEARASGITVTVGEGESIVTALARSGISVEVKCEEGICGTCLTDVLEGEPDHRDHFLTDEEKADNSEMCLCCSRANSARLVLDI
ncbi:oxidoreductase [Pseudooceanicola sediminis]|uniref:Oxidoreductase n=1 Tax=Pseudooceanicola sediminis TaxID=2211117 RepID=A0A399J022_9RHOB|nr:PDR/VanB family oxidoreductase [Pseudooceanicola sediminis]KAA2313950.1 oxidoreductase [Puniceibacterium sp. HSS470]RII38763.1 oxidoreductase [Pseudooceanicola sediminis]|tara:strand:+ start:78746 stop:79702 length:957 start_codon:yes stop_codon:yes gene_type:complete